MKPAESSFRQGWKKLTEQSKVFLQPEKHLKNFIKESGRLEKFSLKGGGIFYDFSRQRLDEKTLLLLLELAEERKLKAQFQAMMSGEKVNTTEKRAALHTASRDFSNNVVMLDGKDVMPEIRKVRDEIKAFAEKIHSGKITGSTGKAFKHIVVIGIGGSYLGTEFVSESLAAFADQQIRIHYLANVDIHNFGKIAAEIEPETTLWIVVSKSYTTAETSANTEQAYAFMKQKGIDPAKHVVTVTAKGSPGDDPSNPVLASFYMFDFIGGRYSVTSAVGGVPLSLYFGYEQFERFLKGAEEMDIHAKTAPPEKNLPLIAALIGIWNNNFLGYPAQAIIPYADPLRKLAPHVQQLYMESNGKSVTKDGEFLTEQSGVMVFGEPGTNAQHSFFQMAHQGRAFPIDFIGVVNPQYSQYQAKSKGVTNYQELWANLIAQPMALALGKDDADKSKCFSGNRPSSTILLEDLSPENVGRLLAFYEAKTVFEAFVWDINPFDQFGVELGKNLASGIRKEMAAKNQDKNHRFDQSDAITKFYLETLFSGKL
ncbi:MAG: glucose-6-phosphate isomerase [Desulfobacteraceae bacterium IS3]|nr:MAG: glucose-6-phosphate isomerase [Desulfobacteraceae bacterium IS3]